MADIVFIAHGMSSPLNTGLELSRRLTEAGHRVTYVSHADIGSTVEAHGFPFVRLTEGPARRQDIASGAGKNPVARFRTLRRTRRASIENDEIERVLAALAPDLLLIDIEMHFAVIATVRLGIPTMLTNAFFTVYRSAGLPPLDTKLMPATSRASEQAIDRAWRRVRVEAFVARIRHKVGKGGIGDLVRPVAYDTLHYADLRQVARARGYPLREHTDRNQWLRPYVYTRLPVLCFTGVEMELPHTPPPNLRYVGPMVSRSRPGPPVADPTRRQWEEFKAQRRSDRPLVYCSLGSYWALPGFPGFYRMVLETFRRRPEWDLVLGLGGQISPGELGPIPPNATVLAWAPQVEVLAMADCAITHGGFGSVIECIVNEVPIIVYSPSLTDQDGNASRVVFHGVGVRAEWDTNHPDALEHHIDRLLSDKSFADNVRTMNRIFDRYVGERTAVRTIEQFLADVATP